MTISHDRTGIGGTAAGVGCVAAAYFGQDSWSGLLVSFGIVAVLMLPIALADLGTPTRPWHRAEMEWRRFKSYALGVVMGWAGLAWFGVLLANVSNLAGLIMYAAPVIVIVLGLGYLFIIHPRLLRRRLMREEFKDDI